MPLSHVIGVMLVCCCLCMHRFSCVGPAYLTGRPHSPADASTAGGVEPGQTHCHVLCRLGWVCFAWHSLSLQAPHQLCTPLTSSSSLVTTTPSSSWQLATTLQVGGQAGRWCSLWGQDSVGMCHAAPWACSCTSTHPPGQECPERHQLLTWAPPSSHCTDLDHT
jgi:hypothetical protein